MCVWVISENNSAVPYDHKSLICLNPSLVTLLYATHTAVRAVHTKQHCCGRRIPWSCSLTYTHTARYPLLPHWTFIHTGGWVSMETCTMQQEPVVCWKRSVPLCTCTQTYIWQRKPSICSFILATRALTQRPQYYTDLSACCLETTLTRTTIGQ